MFRKKQEKPKRNHAGKSLSQYGLFDVPTDLNTGLGNMEDDDGDSDLEAELAALSGNNEPKKPKAKPVKLAVPQAELDRMIAESLKDHPDDEEEVSGDDDDPDLLNELQEIAGSDGEEVTASVESTPTDPPSGGTVENSTVTLLRERLRMYEIAEDNAKKAGETSKVRRFGRALKTIKGLVKDAEGGKDVNMDEIPPEVNIAPKKEPTRPAPEVPSSDPAPSTDDLKSNESPSAEIPVETPKESPSVDQEVLDALLARQKEYKIAALRSKKAGDQVTAIAHLRVVKQFDAAIEAVKNGHKFDLAEMPPPPTETVAPPPQESKPQQEESQQNIPEIPMPQGEIPEETLIEASSVMEALEQRLTVYKEQEAKAKEQGNASKARRLGRIVKQFNDAIKLHKAGKPIPVDELPTPPGYGPIPVEGAAKPEPPKPVVKPVSPKSPSESDEGTSSNSPSAGQTSRVSGNHMPTSRAEKQVMILLAKQKQFKLAALNAKKKGELNEAKEFLRNAKRLDKLIDASRGGLPIDWSSIPISPEAKSQLDNEYDVVMAEECDENTSEDLDVISRLENQLTKQLKMCLTTRDHHKNLGDVAGANRFERLALNVTKDLDVVRVAQRTSGKVPKFHYENKDFSIVKSFTELTDNDLELTIIRGINYTTQYPKDVDTYVKFEFPFPQDTPYSDRTGTVKNTNNPEYNSTYVIPIQRSSRNCQRVFKRHGIKFEVYSKGGFFRSDTLIGTANVKLQPLETQCELHDSFDLLEGRKKVGGKLEVKLRVRQPIVAQQVEQIHEKWLVIDQ